MESRLERAHPLPGDGETLFFDNGHLYVHRGEPVRISVTGMLKPHFPEFDTQGVIARNFAAWRAKGGDYGLLIEYLSEVEGRSECECKAAIAAVWAARGERACAAGTAMHHSFQRELEGWEGPAAPELPAFRDWLGQFCSELHLTPWRSELSVVHEHQGVAVVAGQIDLLLRRDDGKGFVIVDYKRKAASPKYRGGPLRLLGKEEPGRFNTQIPSGPFRGLDNNDLTKYTAQVNAYAHVLYHNYEMDAREGLFLLQFGPDVPGPGWHCIQVPRWDERTSELFDAEIARALAGQA